MASERGPAVTMDDVAARAGVSRALVSIVLRGLPGASAGNRERVVRAAAELDYHPDQRARLLGSGRSRTLGVVYGLHEPFHGDLVEALYAAAAAAGWRLALEPRARARTEDVAVRALLAERVEAVLLLGPETGEAELRALGDRLPVVVLARSLGRGPVPSAPAVVGSVRSDDETAARLAVEHLVALGHRRIAHVHGRRSPGAVERRRGYRRAVGAAGIEVDLVPGGTREADGESAAAQLLGRPRSERPTAVVAFNDVCAAGLLHAVRAAGTLVPQELSVVGFDDSAVASLASVSLTTVGQDARALAERALAQALDRLDGTPAADVVIAPRLVVRGTSAPPR